MISSTPQGAEILDDYHWEATLSPLGLPTGLCIPLDVDKFVSVSTNSSSVINFLTRGLQIPSWEVTSPEGSRVRLKPPITDEEIEVLTAIYNLANTVIANTASRSLSR